MAQHDRRSVAGNLDDILRGVRARGFEERRHHLIDRLAFRVDQFGELRGPRAPGRRIAKAQHTFGSGTSIGPGEAHDPEAAAPERGRNSSDGVVKVQIHPGLRSFGALATVLRSGYLVLCVFPFWWGMGKRLPPKPKLISSQSS